MFFLFVCFRYNVFNQFFFYRRIVVYSVVLISAVQESDSVIHIHTFFVILFHYHLSQDTEYNSPCYTVGPCCLSILYLIVCIC